ncbi:uncharacterized protein LOC120402178 isoform X2 [Mauremys reevesii]|uniref:uncharacterized protein LOC120402178 isoform X2 n=1 Tax=Mauremys reevesii TaxID=260615 RepID=UPI00193F8C63|nr:uncharacterized protein LOC120402178 isoform X2 [Mauremys reevesii]
MRWERCCAGPGWGSDFQENSPSPEPAWIPASPVRPARPLSMLQSILPCLLSGCPLTISGPLKVPRAAGWKPANGRCRGCACRRGQHMETCYLPSPQGMRRDMQAAAATSGSSMGPQEADSLPEPCCYAGWEPPVDSAGTLDVGQQPGYWAGSRVLGAGMAAGTRGVSLQPGSLDRHLQPGSLVEGQQPGPQARRQ